MGNDSPASPSPEELAGREAWFDEYSARVNARPCDLPLRCPCCRCRTLSERIAFEICEVCYWEDDGQDDGDAGENCAGPNGSLSLTEARANYLRFGACEESMIGQVRPPRPEEVPEQSDGEPGAERDHGAG
jgi:hypothetical protein